jgi:hypothetical protein
MVQCSSHLIYFASSQMFTHSERDVQLSASPILRVLLSCSIPSDPPRKCLDKLTSSLVQGCFTNILKQHSLCVLALDSYDIQ